MALVPPTPFLDSAELANLATLSGAQRTVYGALTSFGRRATVGEIAAHVGQHANSVRETLDALVEAGLVNCTRSAPRGRGRPALFYEAAGPDSIDTITSELTALNMAVIQHLVEISPDPAASARRIGELAAELMLPRIHEQAAADAAATDAEAARNEGAEDEAREIHASRIRVLLSSLGFGASTGDEPQHIELRSCPFLVDDARTQHMICQIHGRMAARIMEEISDGEVTAQVYPFNAPGKCLVRLREQGEPAGR